MPYICKMCGGKLTPDYMNYLTVCEFCGTTQTYSHSENESVLNLYVHANELRQKCEFDKAESVYRVISQMEDRDPESYWGALLCEFGIEYVKDPNEGKWKPTCHRTVAESIREHEDYLAAIERSNEEEKAFFEAEAKVIDEIRERILEMAAKQVKYQVFICYKESDEEGMRTRDSEIAALLDEKLSAEGYRVFYASRTLKVKLGEEYEPYIFAALNSAPVMVVLGTKREYFEAVWVRNEWSRYIQLIKKNSEKKMIPVCSGMDPYNLPEELAKYQAFSLNVDENLPRLIDMIREFVNKFTGEVISEKIRDVRISEHVLDRRDPEYASLQKGYDLLMQRRFDEADDAFLSILLRNNKCAEAFFGRILAEFNATSKVNLVECATKPIDQSTFYSATYYYANANLRRELEEINGILTQIYPDGNRQKQREGLLQQLEMKYQESIESMNNATDAKSLAFCWRTFGELDNFKDALRYKKECEKIAAKRFGFYNKNHEMVTPDEWFGKLMEKDDDFYL